MNANVNSSLSARSGATLNLNSGMLTGRSLSSSGTFNRSGGNFNVELLSFSSDTVTIGSNDNVTESLDVRAEGNVICNRPLLLNGQVVVNGGTLTINDDLTATLQVTLTGSTDEPGISNWNQGDITTPCFEISNSVVNRTGGRLMVGSFVLTRSRADGMDHFTIREGDVISEGLSICGTDDFAVSATIEGPHTLGGINQSFNSTVNYQQDSGETEGLALGSYSNFGGSTAPLNLGFDSQSVGGLDWVLRVDGDEVDDLEDRIEDGQIIVTGADFSVEYDAVADVTYIQQMGAAIVVGDVNLDGAVDFLDISPFIARLTSGEFQAEADVDRSGAVDFLDISPFISVLTNQ